MSRRSHQEAEPLQPQREVPNNISGRLVTILDPTGAAAEAYRTLRTNLLYSLVKLPLQIIVVTSPGFQEGKTTICANLGIVLAQANKKTIVVDCDLRRPALHEVFGLNDCLRGLVDALVEEHAPQEVWQETRHGLKVVASGPVPPNPAELLASQRFAKFIEQVRQEFDYVLLDTPPVGLVSDPAMLAIQADGVLLILDAQNTSKLSVRQSMRSLEAVGANVIGTVMNNAKASKGG